MSSNTFYNHILAEYLDIARPSGLLSKVKHNTVHHIHTTPGPAVYSAPRRLAPDRLKIAKAHVTDWYLSSIGFSVVVSLAPSA